MWYTIGMKYVIAILKTIFYMSFYVIVQVVLVKYLKVTNGLIALSIGALISLIVYLLLFRDLRHHVRRLSLQDVNLSLSSGFLTIFISSIVMLAVVAIFPSIQNISEDISNYIKSEDAIIVFIAVVIAAPIIEEIIFRCIIFTELTKVTTVRNTIIIQAVLFGIFHANIYQFIYAFFIGILLGYIYAKTNNILITIIAHMVNNALSLSMDPLGSGALNLLIILLLSTTAILELEKK